MFYNTQFIADFNENKPFQIIRFEDHFSKMEADALVIKTYVIGLNYVDLLRAKIKKEVKTNFEIDIIGQVVAKGELVSDFALGDWVGVIDNQKISTFVTVKNDSVISLPKKGALYDAAATLRAYLSGCHFLTNILTLSSVQKVFLSFPTTPEGLAIIQMLQSMDIDIVAVESNKAKMNFLRHLGLQEILDDESMLLRKDELDLFYVPINSKLIANTFNHHKIPSVIEEVLKNIDLDIYQPLPYQCFSKNEIQEALTLLFQNEFIGKVLVQIEELPSNLQKKISGQEQSYGLTNKEGIDVLLQALQQPLPEIYVSKSPNLEGIVSILERDSTDYESSAIGKSQYNDKDSQTDPPINFSSIMKGIWKEVLDIDSVKEEDNFFDLGGDSLLAIQVCYKVKLSFDISLMPNVLLEQPKFDDFSTIVQSKIESLQGITEP